MVLEGSPRAFASAGTCLLQAPGPRVLTRGAGAAEAVDSVLADPTVDTRAALTLIHVHLTIGACKAWGVREGD